MPGSTHPRSSLSRRKFMHGALGGAAMAAAGPTIVRAAALGSGDRPAPSGRINVGVIGVGKQASGHLQHFLSEPRTQVVGVCDVDTTRREHARSVAAKKYGAPCDGYNDLHDLLARKDLDAVVIGAPDHWHAIAVIEACKAGKDIYCEKPLTLALDESRLLIEAARKYKRVLQTGSQQRSSKEFRTAVEYIRSGRIGKVKSIIVGVGGTSVPCDLPEEKMEPGLDWDRWLGQAPKRPYNSVLSPRGLYDFFPHWRNYREYSGGAMTDWGAHHFDIAQWALDMDHSGPVEIHPPADPASSTGLRYVYANGVEMTHDTKAPGGILFTGSEGSIFVTRGKLTSSPASILEAPLAPGDLHLPVSPGHQTNWLDCIASRDKPICDVEIGARSAAVCHLGNLGYWHGRKLTWDPHRWEFPGDAEANGWRTRERRPGFELPAF